MSTTCTAADELGGLLRGGGLRAPRRPCCSSACAVPGAPALVVAVVPVRPLRTVVIVEPDQGHVRFPDQNDERLRATIFEAVFRCHTASSDRACGALYKRSSSGIRGEPSEYRNIENGPHMGTESIRRLSRQA